MAEISKKMAYEGITVDVDFASPGPTFGDLFLICGEPHPGFPPTGRYPFNWLDDLLFTQADDYFGVRSLPDRPGEDINIWLFPVVANEVVDHHPGPFDGIRLEYCVLRNPFYRVAHFLRCVEGFAALGSQTRYRRQAYTTGDEALVARIRGDIDLIVAHWKRKGVEVGSDKAMMIDN